MNLFIGLPLTVLIPRGPNLSSSARVEVDAGRGTSDMSLPFAPFGYGRAGTSGRMLTGLVGESSCCSSGEGCAPSFFLLRCISLFRKPLGGSLLMAADSVLHCRPPSRGDGLVPSCPFLRFS